MDKRVRTIVDIVVDKSRMGPRDILSYSKRQAAMNPRHVIWYLSRKYALHKSYKSIGRSFSRDHTTILNGIRRIERMRRDMPNIDSLVICCEQEIRGRFPCLAA